MKKISLALCGGGRKGVAYLAFFEEFEKELKKYDLKISDVVEAIAFSSSATLFTSLYFFGYTLEDYLRELKRSSVERVKNLIFSSNYRTYRDFLKRFFGNKRIKDLPVKSYFITLDLVTGKNVVFNKGKLVDVIYAASAHPIIFPPLKKGKYVLVDGGPTQLLPSKFLKEKGFKNIFCFELYKGLDKKDNYHSYIHNLLRSVSLSSYQLMKDYEIFCDDVFILLPNLKINSFSVFESINLIDTNAVLQYYKVSKKVSRKIIKKLIAKIRH